MSENNELKEFIHKAPIGQYLGLSGCSIIAQAISTEKSLKNDAFLYKKGEKAENFFMVSSGRLGLCIEDSNTKRKRIVHVVEPGDLIGELSFITEDPHQIAVQSIGDSKVYVFGRNEINELYEKNPSVMFDFMRAVIKRIHTTMASLNEQRDELATYLATGGKGKL